MITGTVILSSIAITLAVLLVLSSRLLSPAAETVVDRVEGLLPRVQCAQCGYPGCRPYAAAVVAGNAEINLCPPGGEETVRRLAKFLGRDIVPLRPDDSAASLDRVARIAEELCIGCNLCSRVCPVDAIVGVHQMMHTVISTHCTGCELCLPPCPVNCISFVSRHA